MKILAGILIIAAAFINVFGGTGYVFGGACFHMFADTVEDAANQHEKQAGPTKGGKDLKKAAGKAKKLGGHAVAFGLFLWLLTILQFVAAVLIFLETNRAYVMVICVLSIAAEMFGMVMLKFAFWQLVGIAAGGLGFVAALRFAPKSAQGATPA